MSFAIKSVIAVSLVVVGISMAGPCTSTEKKLQVNTTSPYPCDVFNYNFCFKKPYGTAVTLSSGPDFEIYQVSEPGSEHPLWSIYVGTAPERARHQTHLISSQADGVKISVGTYLIDATAQGMELRLQYPTGLFVHIFGVDTERGESALVEMLTSFRYCSKQGITSIACKTAPILNDKAQQVLRNSRN